MPIAQKFKALGAGNGFPSCLPKTDVSGAYQWTTLGGNKKGGSVTEAGKGFAEAMNLFWNLNGVSGGWSRNSGTITVDLDGGNFDGATWYNADTAEYVRGVNKLPHERVCYSEWAASAGFVQVGNNHSTPSDGVLISCKIFKMYNGSTDSEDNFVGYGCDGFKFESFGLFVTFRLGSVLFSEYESRYIKFNGMDFVASYYAEIGEDTTVIFTGGTTATVSESYQTSGGTTVTTEVAYLSSPTFYTYPQT